MIKKLINFFRELFSSKSDPLCDGCKCTAETCDKSCECCCEMDNNPETLKITEDSYVEVSDGEKSQVKNTGKKSDTPKEQLTKLEEPVEAKDDFISIEKYAFKNDKNISKITFDHNVNRVCMSAFYGCTNLKTVIVDTDVIPEIERNVFYCRKEGKSIIIPGINIYVPDAKVEEFKQAKGWEKYAKYIKPLSKM